MISWLLADTREQESYEQHVLIMSDVIADVRMKVCAWQKTKMQ